MSYILDALKKAQKDRAREGDIDFEDITGIAWDSIESKIERPGLAGNLIFSIIVVALLTSFVYFIYNIKSIEPVFPLDKDYSELEDRKSFRSKVPKEDEASESRRQGITENFERAPNISVTGSIYIGEGASGNKIFIGDRAYREGDIIDDHWVLFHIGAQAIELRAGDTAFLINY